MANIFGKKHDIGNRVSALVTTGVSYIVSKFHELQMASGDFTQPSVISALYFIAMLCTR